MRPAAADEVRSVLVGLPLRADLLLEYLHRLQDAYGHLREAHLAALAFELGMGFAEVYEVATFYHNFDVVGDGAAAPRSRVRVCESLPCALAGAAGLVDALRGRLPADVRVCPTACLGRCADAPAVLVGRGAVAPASLAAVEAAVAAGRTEPELPSYRDYDAYRGHGGYRLLAECVAGARSREAVAAEVEASRLRGLGGAGFPVARKWRTVRAEPAPRVMVLNADESEPGTFKDRHCLSTDPHRVIEGALLAAWAVEAAEVYLYVRDEYADVRAILARELAALASDPPCSLPVVDLRRGAGSYICGEETALLESIEGRRAEPRLRPPYPAQAGLFGRPTLVHNVETVYWLREIVEDGGARFASQGTNGASGRRLFSVSGRVARPGVHLAPSGITVRELIDGYAGGMRPGHAFHAFLPAGASGGILPASLDRVPLDFGTLEPHGSFIGPAGIIVLSDRDRVDDAARSLMHFFARESCGECTPCRSGTARAARMCDAGEWRSRRVGDLCRVLGDASICGLGQAAPNVVRTVLRYFPEEVGA